MFLQNSSRNAAEVIIMVVDLRPSVYDYFMIEVTRLNGTTVLINSDLIETVEETPDTVISLTTGKKFIVKESRQEVKNLVKSYKRDIFTNGLLREE